MRFDLKQFEEWFQSTPGKQLLEAEKKLLSQMMGQLFGYHLLQLGGHTNYGLHDFSAIDHHIYLSPDENSHFLGSCLKADFIELPFQTDSLDVVLLPHTLEYSKNPEQILNEVFHTLRVGGHVVILGFNPFSLVGLTKLFSRKKKMPWCGHFLSILRVRQMLSKLGLHVVDYKSEFFRPLLQNENKLEKLLFLEAVGQLCWPYLGAFYLIVAQKSAAPLISIKSLPLKKKRLLTKVPIPTSF